MTDPQDDVDRRVRAILVAVRRGIEVDVRSSWRQLGLDSLDLLEVVTRAEDEFSLTIPDRVVVRLRGPADLMAHVRSGSAEVPHEPPHPVDRTLVEVNALVELEDGHANR